MNRIDDGLQVKSINRRKELEREVVSITTDDILYISDVKSEKRAVDLTQERFLPRINIGNIKAIGLE